jgi:hypothetical protein
MRSFSPILSHTETSVPFGDFYISVSRLRSMSSREVATLDLIFSFFCTCAELAVVSRQKDKGNKVRYFPLRSGGGGGK